MESFTATKPPERKIVTSASRAQALADYINAKYAPRYASELFAADAFLGGVLVAFGPELVAPDHMGPRSVFAFLAKLIAGAAVANAVHKLEIVPPGSILVSGLTWIWLARTKTP